MAFFIFGYNRLLDGTISSEDFQKIKTTATEKIAELKARIALHKKDAPVNIDVVAEILKFTKNIYETYLDAPEKVQKQLIRIFFDGFEVKDGLIIKERYSPLFEELLALKSMVYKNSISENALRIRGKSKRIINPNLGAHRGSNPR